MKSVHLQSNFILKESLCDSIWAVSESKTFEISDQIQIQVLNKIKSGGISIEDLVEELSHSTTSWEIIQSVWALNQRGIVSDSKSPFSEEESAFWQNQKIDPIKLNQVLNSNPITVKSIGKVDDQYFRSACQNSGIRMEESESALQVALVDDYANEEISRVNSESLTSGNPWLLLKMNGTEVLTGPLFIPGKSGCWSCLKHRLDLHSPMKIYGNGILPESANAPASGHPASFQIAANIAVLHLIRWLYSPNQNDLVGKVHSFDLKTLQTCSHELIKRPQCPTCGNPNLVNKFPDPIHLDLSEPVRSKTGGYRTVPPEETFAKYRHHVSTITGVISCLNPYGGIDSQLIHNFYSGPNLALKSKSKFWLNMHLRSGSGGKGKTEIQAKTGAVCEAIERYCLTYQGSGFTVLSSMESHEDAIHPNECMNFSALQYANREAFNAKESKFYSLVPVPFDCSEEMEWTPIYSLTHKKFKYLPTCYCFSQYPAEDESRLYSYPDSNGCAAGNTIEEAILQGFLELVERDAAAIWWYNRIKHPAVDIDSFNNPYLKEVESYYSTIGRKFYVLDITNDIGIPVFVAISYGINEVESDKILYAFGAHMEAEIALERAIIELNQLLPVVQNMDTYKPDMDFSKWLSQAKLAEQTYLIPDEVSLPKRKGDFIKLCNPTLRDSLNFCLETISSMGLELLVLDLTQADIGLPVVKVMVPGLRHFWRRTGSGRLYSVPVKMGWLSKPNQETELNPISIFV